LIGPDKERERLKEIEAQMWLGLPAAILAQVKAHHVKGNELYVSGTTLGNKGEGDGIGQH
jgi:hypothetical protein